ncbi:MAG: hypothetical protein M1820_002820 [Bogoriella megaspora]|nr:MAG: hypothetical protein M1820_002820 [Bogoriella megaspora]
MASIDKRCENWYHFDKLLRKLLRYEFYYCESACKGYMESQTDLDMHLDRPARALGLPPRVVRAMLKRSPVAVAFYGSDIDIFRRLSRGSIDVLISKLLGDRMMIEAVVTDSVDYAILLGRLMELQRKFFVSLDSATVYTLTQFGRDYEYFNLESKLETEIDGKIRQWKEKTASVWSTVTDGYRRLLQ